MPNMAAIINSHNKKISTTNAGTKPKPCNCRNKDLCPLNGNCQTPSVIYKAEVTEGSTQPPKQYIGLTENTFKQRFNAHKHTFRHTKHENSTELSKYIWQLKRQNKEFNINWSICNTTQPYSNETKRCDLCLSEKLCIINAYKPNLLNSRSELISKCRHENKFYITSCTKDIT